MERTRLRTVRLHYWHDYRAATMIWWLSFTDEDDGRWLGGCFVEVETDDIQEEGIKAATVKSWEEGCNPGGGVLLIPCPKEEQHNPTRGAPIHHLFTTKEEIEKFFAVMAVRDM